MKKAKLKAKIEYLEGRERSLILQQDELNTRLASMNGAIQKAFERGVQVGLFGRISDNMEIPTSEGKSNV